MDYQDLNKKKISSFVETQLPEFVRSQFALNNGKTLIHRFIELYYEWLEKEYDLTISDMSGRSIKEFGSTQILNRQNEVGNPYNILTKLQSYTDVDRTIYPLLQFLRNQYMMAIPQDIETDLRKTLKLMKHYNVRKGTKKAFEFIFRVLFNKTVVVEKPADKIFILDSVKWSESSYMYVQVIGGIEPTVEVDLTGFIGYYVLGETSGATAKVVDVHSYYIKSTRITEFLLDKKSIKRTPDFTNNEYVQAVSILNQQGSTTYIPVNKSGTTSQLRAKAIAGINSVRWETPGSGHDFEDSIQLSNNGSATGVSGLSGGSTYSTGTDVATTGGSGTGLKVDILTLSGSTPATIQISSGFTGLGYADNELITITGGDGNATFRINGVDNEGGASARITNLTKGPVDDVKIDTTGQNYKLNDEVFMIGAYLNVGEMSTTAFAVGDRIIGEETGATADIRVVVGERLYIDNVLGRFKTDVSRDEPYGGETIIVKNSAASDTEILATAMTANSDYYIKELGDFTIPLPSMATSSGADNRTIALPSHNLVAHDFVKFPSGTDSSFEVFQVESVTNANAFVVSSNLSNAISAQLGFTGLTDFVAVGASENRVGIVFTATGAGKGSGKVYPRNKYGRVRWVGEIESNTAVGEVDSINTTITLSSAGSFTIGEKVTGSNSGAIGTVVSNSGTTLIVSRTKNTYSADSGNTHYPRSLYTDGSVFSPNITDFVVGDTVAAVSGNGGSGVSKTQGSAPVNGQIARVKVVYRGSGFAKSPQEYIFTDNGAGATLTPYGSTIGGIERAEIVSAGVSYGTNSTAGSNTKTSPWTPAVGTPSVSVIIDTIGMYANQKGTLSTGESNFINEEIVPFSYKIGSDLAYEKWVKVIMEIGAPAGMTIFPNQFLNDKETSTKVISGRIGYFDGSSMQEANI